MGSNFSQAGRQHTNAKSSQSTSQIKPFDLYKGGIAGAVRPMTQSSIKLSDGPGRSSEENQVQQPSFIPSNELLSSHGKMISINSNQYK